MARVPTEVERPSAGRGIRPAVIHGVTDFDAGRITIADQTAHFRFQNCNEVSISTEIVRGAMNCGCELTFQFFRSGQHLIFGTAMNDQCGGAEDLIHQFVFGEERLRVSCKKRGVRLAISLRSFGRLGGCVDRTPGVFENFSIPA